MKLKPRQITVIFIVAVAVIIGAYDVFAINTGGLEASISHTMIEWSKKFPLFTFLMGITAGHLFWHMRETPIISEIVKRINESQDPEVVANRALVLKLINKAWEEGDNKKIP